MELRWALELAWFLEGDNALALSRNALSIFSMSDLRGGAFISVFGISAVKYKVVHLVR